MGDRDSNGLTRRPIREVGPAPGGDHLRNDSDSASKTGGFSLVLKVLLSFLCGAIMGFVMEKGRVFEPRSIRHQMVFKKMIMLKMFISALATGMFCLAIVAMIPRTHRKFFLACNKYYNSLRDKGVLSSIIGGTILGIGMTLAGSCPTVIFVQLGAMVKNSGYVFAGALCGVTAYGVLKPLIDKVTKPMIEESSNPWATSPYFIMALPLAAMFGIVVCSFEMLVPWTKDVKVKDDPASYLEMKAWPPYIAGMVVGSLQVPLLLGLGETLGGSSSFTTLVAQVFVGPLKRLSPFIAKYRCGFGTWWQIFFVCGVMLGAYVSANMSGYVGTVRGVSPEHAFIGGFLIIFGARIAGGCTSGHGLSGMSFLSIMSVITTSCLFGAAIATGFVMQHMGVLKLP